LPKAEYGEAYDQTREHYEARGDTHAAFSLEKQVGFFGAD
jgi:hypothetical protein